MKNYCTAILLLFVSTAASAQRFTKEDMTFAGKNFYGFALNTNPYRQSNGYFTYDVEIGFQTEPSDSCEYVRAYRCPLLSVGISVSSLSDFVMDGNSFLPDIYSVYGAFERTHIRKERFSFGHLLNLGITTNPGVYDPVNNPGNTFLSSPVMCYFGGGFFMKWQVGRHWEAGAEVMYRHYSNGMLSVPNGGMDVVGAGVFARYRMAEYSAADFRETSPKPSFKDKGMVYHISFSGGVHSCWTEFEVYNEMVKDPTLKQIKFKKHPRFSFSADAMYRYALKYATGIGVDVYYSSNMRQLKECDRILYGKESIIESDYKPISLGIAIVQELYWRNLAGYIALGAYPYLRNGISGCQDWHYEKAGLRYYFSRIGNTFVGFAIKAHNFRAENFEFTVGMKMG